MEPIDGEEALFRRIIHYQYDETTGAISASAFMRKKKLDPEVSVFLARLSEPNELLAAGLPSQFLAVLKAQVAYDAGLDVIRQPLPNFPGHCVIVGFTEEGWKGQCLRLAEGSRLVELAEQPAE